MAERAAWLVERVVPHVATLQWVLTVPWKRRWLLARHPELALGVLRSPSAASSGGIAARRAAAMARAARSR